MSIPVRPLGIVRQMVEEAGLIITHVYDDLVFIEHNAFLLQMGEVGKDGSQVLIHFNVDSEEDKRDIIETQFKEIGSQLGVELSYGGTYKLEKHDDENIDVKFLGK